MPFRFCASAAPTACVHVVVGPLPAAAPGGVAKLMAMDMPGGSEPELGPLPPSTRFATPCCTPPESASGQQFTPGTSFTRREAAAPAGEVAYTHATHEASEPQAPQQAAWLDALKPSGKSCARVGATASVSAPALSHSPGVGPLPPPRSTSTTVSAAVATVTAVALMGVRVKAGTGSLRLTTEVVARSSQAGALALSAASARTRFGVSSVRRQRPCATVAAGAATGS